MEENNKTLWTEAYTQLFPNWENNDILDQEDQARIKAFMDGAKWQEKRSYSEEEVLELLHKRMIRTLGDNYEEYTSIEWFEQNKKKFK